MRHLRVSFRLSSSHGILWVCVAYQIFTCIWKAGVTSHLWKFSGGVWPLSVKVSKLFSGGEWNSPDPWLCRRKKCISFLDIWEYVLGCAWSVVSQIQADESNWTDVLSFQWQVENASVALKEQIKGERILARELWWESLLFVTLIEQGKGIQFSSFI